jgi:putative acetyltransferase
MQLLWFAGPGVEASAMIIRSEISTDASPIRALTDAAFAGVWHSSQTEGAIVDALRQAGALTISLVAEQDNKIIGHVAFSPVLVAGKEIGWFGLGPVSVSPSLQRRGIGAALIEEGLRLLKNRSANGCVVLGDPNYYGRFGFSSEHALRYSDAPSEYFQSMVLSGDPAKGNVTYHEGFEAR